MGENRNEPRSSEIVFCDLRKPQQAGDSISLTCPLRAMRDELDIDPEELTNRSVRVALYEDGTLQASLKG